MHSLNNIGTMQLLHDRPEGWETLSRSLALAEQDGLEEHIGRAFIHLGWAMARTRAHQYAHWLDRGIIVCEELGLEGWEAYVIAYRARYHLDRGAGTTRWPTPSASCAPAARYRCCGSSH